MPLKQEFFTPKNQKLIPGVSIKGINTWNVLQNRIALIGIIMVIFVLLIPPWKNSNLRGDTAAVGHYLVFFSQITEEYKYPTIDFGRLFLEIIGISVLFGVGLFLTRSNKE